MPTRKTNRGQSIDMDALFNANKNVPAVGNMQVNANGDVIDSKGNIIKKKEQRVREYYRDNPKSSTSGVSLKGDTPEMPQRQNPAPDVKTARTAQATVADTPPPPPVEEPEEFTQPEEFDAPADQEPIGYKEVHLPSGDIEMVPFYKTDDPDNA